MITLERDGKRMEVATELQASAFLKNGYERVEVCSESKAEEAVEPVEQAQPKVRKRRSKADVAVAAE